MGLHMARKPNPTIGKSLALMGQLGLSIAFPIALFTVGGNYLDGFFHTNSHILLLFGLLLGLISGIYGAYRLLKSSLS